MHRLTDPDLHVAASAADYDAVLQRERVRRHWAVEQDLARAFGWTGRQRLVGWCTACRGPSRFEAKRAHVRGGSDGYRNSLRCERCRLPSRQRLAADLLFRLAAPGARVHATEHATPSGRWLGTGPWAPTTSEFLGDGCAGGTVHGGVRHEDAMALSFADGSFAVQVSCDVLEHVPDHRRALAESARVLSGDGVLVLTVPFAHRAAATVVRAVRDGDRVRHLLPPVFHADPLRRGGALVYRDFGWDLLDDVRAAGFAAVTILVACCLQRAWLGHPNQCFVCWKTAPTDAPADAPSIGHPGAASLRDAAPHDR